MESETQEERLAARIVEGAADAILFADREGKVRLWNPGAERIFGFTAAEALGRSLDLIVPEKQRSRHWTGWDRVLETGTTKYSTDTLAVPALRKDGSTLSVEFTIQMVRDEMGILGFAAILRDVTARFQREKALGAQLKELRQKLAGK